MKVSKNWLILAVLFIILNMVIATQYATTKIGYEYYIVHPSDANIRYIGSDNSSDSIRVLRVIGSNITNVFRKHNKKEIPEKENISKQLAKKILNTIPQVYGFNIYSPIARRWCTQFNENSKIICRYDG
ncbi:unnamed protein product, partial [marine sediment metagenome]